MLNEFKDFLLRGNIVELAVAFVMGVAFGAVVNSFVNDLVMPVIAMIIGKPDFSNLTFTINDAVFRYGAVPDRAITFLATAASVFFFIVKPMNAISARSFRPGEEEVPDESAVTRSSSRRCAPVETEQPGLRALTRGARSRAARPADRSARAAARRPPRARAGRPARTPRGTSCRGGSSASRPGRRRSPPGARRGPGSLTEWIGTSPPIRAAVALAVPDGASSFVSAWSSTISACGNDRAASSANRIIRTAPSAKFGATKHGTPALAGGVASASTSNPVVPTTSGTRAASAAAAFPRTAAGRGEVDGDVASVRAGGRRRRRPRGRRARARARARTRPCRSPRRGDPHDRSASAGFTRAIAARNRRSRGPIPAAERRSGANSVAAPR